jgi:biopolymer transport protein ExbD
MSIQLKQGRVIAALSMTPMIDVVFLLLIFFLVASRLSQEDRQLDIALPSASQAMPMTAQPRELVVNVDQQGRLFVDSLEMELDALERLLHQRRVDNPLNQSVIIRADRRVQFQTPIDVMDVCLKLGIPYSASIADEES